MEKIDVSDQTLAQTLEMLAFYGGVIVCEGDKVYIKLNKEKKHNLQKGSEKW